MLLVVVQAHVIEEEDRVPVTNGDALPFSALGKVRFEDNSTCIGTMVSSNYVLCAGTCFFSDGAPLNGTENARFYPSFNASFGYDDRRDEDIARVVTIRIQTKKPLQRVGLNYALLKLDHKVGDTFGFVPLAEDFVIQVEQTVTMLSYDDAIAENVLLQQSSCLAYYDMEVDTDTDYPIRHDCDTSTDLLGGPLMLKAEGFWHVVGIHTGHDEDGFIHVATGYQTIAKEYGELLWDDDRLVPPDDDESTATDDADVAGKGTLIVCIVLIALIWLAVVVIMKRMSM